MNNSAHAFNGNITPCADSIWWRYWIQHFIGKFYRLWGTWQFIMYQWKIQFGLRIMKLFYFDREKKTATAKVVKAT